MTSNIPMLFMSNVFTNEIFDIVVLNDENMKVVCLGHEIEYRTLEWNLLRYDEYTHRDMKIKKLYFKYDALRELWGLSQALRNTNTDAIKPCKFCMSTSVSLETNPHGMNAVICHNCGAMGPVLSNETDAIRTWNEAE